PHTARSQATSRAERSREARPELEATSAPSGPGSRRRPPALATSARQGPEAAVGPRAREGPGSRRCPPCALATSARQGPGGRRRRACYGALTRVAERRGEHVSWGGRDFTRGATLRQLATFSGPIVLANLLQTLFQL